MSQSDRQLLDDLTARVEKLEQQVAQLLPKELHQELYGSEVDHTDERAERAALTPRRPGRPPGS